MKTQLFYVGEESGELKIEMVRNDKVIGYLYFDKESYMLVREERLVEWTPGVTVTTTTTFEYSINAGLDDSLFSVEQYADLPAGPQC
jgi:outer membrane lipoprotein-sorting protein